LRIENSSEIYSISQLLLRNERKNEKVGWIYLSDAFQKRKKVFPKFLFFWGRRKDIRTVIEDIVWSLPISKSKKGIETQSTLWKNLYSTSSELAQKEVWLKITNNHLIVLNDQ